MAEVFATYPYSDVCNGFSVAEISATNLLCMNIAETFLFFIITFKYHLESVASNVMADSKSCHP